MMSNKGAGGDASSPKNFTDFHARHPSVVEAHAQGVRVAAARGAHGVNPFLANM
ncbi:hypothetical protein ACT3UD_16725 [Glutamicibacter sp. 287]|uniref:hypothetical protein n=1 Tax=Micrococcaceae TaxID=1268 RepID=UPI001596D94D|nr:MULTISPECIES: hypothetical protein [Micrococcaceae]